MDQNFVIEVKDLRKVFNTNYGDLVAVDKVNFNIRKGEIFGLVGESGSGKTTIGSVIAGIYNATNGEVTYKGQYDLSMNFSKRKKWLKKDIQLVFQDPGGSLNPSRTIRQSLSVPLELYDTERLSNKSKRKKLGDILIQVGLTEEYLDKYPSSIGGGEKQLVCVGRALAANPSFIVLDEPTSALDVSIQAKITNKLIELQKKHNLSYLFITHNLCLVRNICDRIAIMYLGEIFEHAKTVEFFKNPLHPYTKMLLASIPVLSSEEESLKPKKIKPKGEIPSPLNRPTGCSFHPRCTFKKEICERERPRMKEIDENHFVACHLYDEY